MDRIPHEFQYWENLSRPGNKRLRQMLKLVFKADPALPDETVRKWAHSYYDADPVAEAFVDEVYLKQGQKAGRAMIDQALEHGVDSVQDAPHSLKVLFAEMEKNPVWLDLRKVALGAKVFRRYGTHMYSFAGAITLEGYLENSVAKPLAFTGAYTGESAQRRFLETASFWVDVSEPNGLLPGGEGRKTALRVRIMHVFVRRRLLKHPQWDLAGWGVPISQGDALLTLMGGSFIPGMVMKVLGYRTTNQEIEAMMHFWRYVGHLMGVQPRWYPQTLAEAAGLMYASMVKGVKKSGDDGKNLALSYVASYAPTKADKGFDFLAKRLEYGLQLGYTSLFIPPPTFKAYGLPKPGLWRLHPFAQAPVIFALETLRKNVPGIDALVDARKRNETKQWLKARLGERHSEYAAVENFTR